MGSEAKRVEGTRFEVVVSYRIGFSRTYANGALSLRPIPVDELVTVKKPDQDRTEEK